MKDNHALRRARQRAAAKLGVYIHFTVYVLVNILLFAINMGVNPGQLWFLWVVCGWGIGVVFHGVCVFFGAKIIRALTVRELKKGRGGE